MRIFRSFESYRGMVIYLVKIHCSVVISIGQVQGEAVFKFNKQHGVPSVL